MAPQRAECDGTGHQIGQIGVDLNQFGTLTSRYPGSGPSASALPQAWV
jgi:hypothetical protein